MHITKKSGLTGKVHTRDIPVKPEDYADWQFGQNSIQECIPYLSADDREFLMTGITPEEWEAAFG